MMRHVGDPGLGLAALGDIDGGHQIAVAAVERDAPSEGQHMDFAAVRPDMPPVAAGMIDVADLAAAPRCAIAHSSCGQICCSFMPQELCRGYSRNVAPPRR